MPSLFPRFPVVVRFPPGRPTRFARVFLYEGQDRGERREQFKLLAVECLVPQEPQQED